MSKAAQRKTLTDLLDKITPELPEKQVVSILQEIIRTIGEMNYRLRDMPLVTGAVNLLVSSIALDHEEKETSDYSDDTSLRTIIDLVVE